MTSMTCKRMAAVAALATSVMLMGGAALASPASAVVGGGGGSDTTELVPGPVSKAYETFRNTLAEGDRQIRELQRTF